MSTTTAKILESPPEFRRHLVIDVGGQPTRFLDVMDDWQLADFEALDPGWRAVAGVGDGGTFRAYLERGRGHSKTTDIAVMASWLIYSSRRLVRGYVVAGDSDQARLDVNAIEMLCRLNPPLAQVLEVRRNVVVNRETGSELVVLSSDSLSSYGLMPDFIIVDELTHWTTSSEALWHSLFSSAAKRAKCMLVVISNAGCGMGMTWQWNLREAARQDASWYFSRLDGPVASWITPAQLAEQARFLPPQVYRRLWCNEWTSNLGDMLTAQQIEAAVDDNLRPMDGAEPGFPLYACAIDLATKRDHAAAVLIAIEPRSGRYRVADVTSWIPLPEKPVDLELVYQHVLQINWAFPGCQFAADAWQAELLVQRAAKRGVNIVSVPMTGRTLNAMATITLQCFVDGVITTPRDAALIRDLQKISIVPKPFGVKIEAPRDAHGHADRAMALSMALVLGNEMCASYVEPLSEPQLNLLDYYNRMTANDPAFRFYMQ